MKMNEFICSFCNTESEDVGRLSAEQFVGHLRGTHKDDPAALTMATHIEEVYCQPVVRSVSQLRTYEATLFVGLTETLQPPYSDDEAFDLLAKHRDMITERERRRFDAYATARAIRESETSASDTAMLNWLQAKAEEGHISIAFEVDGGLYVTIDPLGEQTAIEKLMEEDHS